MMYKLITQQNAIEEREKILAWYEQQSEQATRNFLVEYKKTTDKIKLSPFQFRISQNKNYREIKMKKYPYHIIFRIDENNKNIVVVRVYHTSRNPDNKYKKLK